jgi:hypothetical protein
VSLLIFLDHFFFVETLNRHDSARFFLFAQTDLSKGPSSDHTDALEAPFADLLSAFSQFLHFLLNDVVFGQFSLLECKVELFDLLLESFPTLVTLFLFKFVEVVLSLDEAFGLLRFQPGRLAYYYISFHILSVKF